MGKLTLKFKQNVADILLGTKTTNLITQNIQFGTDNTTAEAEANTALDTAVGSRTAADLKERLNKDQVVGVFFVNGTFTTGTIMKEIGLFFDPLTTGDLAARDTTNSEFPFTIAADTDIRVDFTITHEQA